MTEERQLNIENVNHEDFLVSLDGKNFNVRILQEGDGFIFSVMDSHKHETLFIPCDGALTNALESICSKAIWQLVRGFSPEIKKYEEDPADYRKALTEYLSLMFNSGEVCTETYSALLHDLESGYDSLLDEVAADMVCYCHTGLLDLDITRKHTSEYLRFEALAEVLRALAIELLESYKVIEQMNLKFTSGNSVPVERSTITAHQWESIQKLLKFT